MKTSHPAKPVLDIIGNRDRELGPFADGEAEQSPWANWRLRTDEDGIAWLLLDKKGSSANTLSADVLMELFAVLQKVERDQPRGLVIRSAKRSRFCCRRRHRGVPRHHRAGTGRSDRGLDHPGPRRARLSRPLAAADRCGDPRLLSRRRARTGAGLRFPYRHRRRELRLSGSAARPASRPRRHGAAASADRSDAGHDHDADRQDRARAPRAVAASGRRGDAGAPRARRGEGCGQR